MMSRKKRDIEEAKKVLRMCNAARACRHDEGHWATELWHGQTGMCGECCPECTTDDTLRWVWPELAGYDIEMTEQEWTEWPERRTR